MLAIEMLADRREGHKCYSEVAKAVFVTCQCLACALHYVRKLSRFSLVIISERARRYHGPVIRDPDMKKTWLDFYCASIVGWPVGYFLSD